MATSSIITSSSSLGRGGGGGGGGVGNDIFSGGRRNLPQHELIKWNNVTQLTKLLKMFVITQNYDMIVIVNCNFDGLADSPGLINQSS
jgi:hypothetical protein